MARRALRKITSGGAVQLGGWALALAGLLAGCGSPAAGAEDAGPVDAAPAPPDTVCPVPEGRAHVMQEFTMLPPGEGFDLNGDGVVDNMMGNLPEATRAAMHDGVGETIASGEMIELLQIGDWSDSPSPDDPDLYAFLMGGFDGESPLNMSNNFTGQGTFYGFMSDLDINCQPRTTTDEGRIEAGVLIARTSAFPFQLTAGTGELVLADAIIEGTFDETYTNLSTRAGAVITLCSLAAVPFPGATEGTILELLVNDPTIAAALSVDVDRDGDGPEAVIGDGQRILKCIDGDGTEIQDRDCACDPRIADGYSSAFQFEWVHGTIIGFR